MGKDIKKRLTVSLDIDTKDVEKQIKATAENIKTILTDMGNASDKMGYFKELANYLSQVDAQLSGFRQKYGEDLFGKMFGGFDTNLQKELEGIFGVTKEQLTALEQLKEKVMAAKNNGATTGADLKPIEQEVKSLYEAIGMIDKLDLSGKGKVETRIKKLEAALSNFATIWDGLNDKIKEGLIFNKQNDSSIGDAIVEDIKDTSKNITNEFDKLKKLIKQKVKEVYDAQIDSADMKKLDQIKKPLYDALSLSPDDDDFYKIEDVFDELLDDGEEKKAIKKITAIVEAQQNAKQRLSKASSPDTADLGQNDSVADTIKNNSDETVKVIDIAKNKLVAAWKKYFNDVEEAKNDGYDLLNGESSMQMDDTQFNINQMLKEWGAKATKGDYKSNVEYALDLSGYIIDGDIDINGIEREINKIFEENGIAVDIPLEKISIELGDVSQQNTKEMASGLENVEIKTNDVATSFQKLISYISQSGQSPKSFFDALETGAQSLDDELKNILTSLNLIDGKDNIKLTSLKSGFSNSGGMISDKYVLISRDADKLPFSLAAKEKTSEAKALGANIGAVLEVYEDKANGLIYELQNKVSGKGILDFKKGIVNTDFLKATDDQIQKLIEDLQILQKTGLYVDWNGDNILYDKENGLFSFIDFFTDSVQPYTVGKDNTLQENLDKFFDNIFNFKLDESSLNKIDEFENNINKIISSIDYSNEQQTAQVLSQDALTSTNAAIPSIKKEKSAHEENTNTINAENKALQAQIELKKKAQSMTWESFALDESSLDLKKAAGFQSLNDMEKFWKQSNYDKNIDFKQLTEDETKDILDEDSEFYKLRSAWYGGQNFDAKNKIENMILANDKLRNAAMNKLYQVYQKYVDSAISFDEFLNSEFTVYRGDDAPAIFGDTEKLSFSFKSGTAYSFGSNVKATKIIPKETIGSAATPGSEYETEVFVPISKLPYNKGVFKSFDDYVGHLDDEIKAALDYKLVEKEKKQVRNLLGEDLSDKFHNFADLGVLDQFNRGIVPKKLYSTGDDWYNDSFIESYNELPDIKKKLVAYYSHLSDLSQSLSANVHNTLGTTHGLSAKLGSTGLANAVINDSAGLKRYISQLTNESKYGLFGQDASAINQETVAHQKNTQAIREESQAQQELNNSKFDDELILDEFNLNEQKYSIKDYENKYKYQSDEAKKSINDYAVFYQEYQDLMSKINTQPVDITFPGIPTVSDIKEVQDALETFKTLRQEIVNMPFVETEDDKKKLQELQAEAVGLQNKLKGALIDGADYEDYKNAYNLSSYYDADLLKTLIHSDPICDIVDKLNNQLMSKKADVSLKTSVDFSDMILNDSSDSFEQFALQQLKTQQDITAEKQKQASLDDSITNNQIKQATQVGLDETQTKTLEKETIVLDELLIKINNVEQAIKDKTQAFIEEGNTVDQVVQQELLALSKLAVAIDEIQLAVNSIEKISITDDINNEHALEYSNIPTVDTVSVSNDGYALNSTLLTTNGILENILMAIGNNESFAQLIDPLNAAVTELKNVANGIVEHQKKQKTDYTAASSKIANNYGQLSSIATNAVSSLGDEVQIKQMKSLADDVVRVEGAVKNADGVWKGFIVDINESNNAVIHAIDEQSTFAKTLNETAESAKKVVKEAGPQDKFTQSLSAQKSAFNEYRKSLEDVDYLNDELIDGLEELTIRLQSISNADSLEDWKDDFGTLKDEISVIQGVFNKIETEKIKEIRGKLNSEFKTLDFTTTTSDPTDEQQEILDLRKQLLTELEKSKEAIKDGKEVEISSLNEIMSALRQKISLYREANDLESGSKQKFGSTATLNATAKYNSLKQQANSGEFASSSVVQQAFQQFEEAYNRLIAKRKELSKVEGELTDTQKSEFKQLQTEYNDYAKILNKIITDSKKLEANSVAHELLGEDFDGSDDGRKAALKDFVEEMYGASATIGEFKDGFNKLTFTVDNGDGTFTEMTATINAARTAIDATAGTAKKATTAFESFFNELKGKFKSISAYLISSFSIQEVWQQIRKGVEYVREIDSALTELKKVTDETDETYQKFLQTMSNVAGVVGSTTSELTQSASDWARLGYSIEEAGELAKNTAILMNVSEFDNVNDATEALISSLQAFGYEASNSIEIVDKLNIVGKIVA